jgi:SAM-dependent methyltransferase
MKKRQIGLIKDILNDFHNYMIDISDKKIDLLLNLSEPEKIADNITDLKNRFGYEQFFFEATPYIYIRHIIHMTEPKLNDVIYDLGSGYGRLIIYGSVVSDALFKGIEIVPNRVDVAEKVRSLLKLENSVFIEGNAKEKDFSDGDIFFLFNPFTASTLECIGKKMANIAKAKKVIISTWGGPSNRFFASQTWLRERKSHLFREIQFFESTYV